jgi:citrate synthase
MIEKATLKIGDQLVELPIIEGTNGDKAIDITGLRSQTGYIAYDPGYGNTGSCLSAITFIDGEKGILRYRGIPIEQFDRKAPNFIEVAWLVIFGKLPTAQEMTHFTALLTQNSSLDESMKHHFEGFPENAPPMAMLSAMINALSCFHPEFFNITTDSAFEAMASQLISKIRTIAAYSYRRGKGLPYIYPHPHLKYCANFLHMMFSMPYELHQVEPEIEDALNLILILHADHEQNCSTATARMVGSSQANLFASCASAVCALWGPLHGGANSAVIQMLDKIHKGNISPEACIKMAKDKKSQFRLMGFGHRVYKNYDPRARILKKMCDRIFAKIGLKDPLLDIALKLEELALKDAYFIERKLYPNVDFYSGILLRAMNIPTEMFPVMFAIGRLPGWIAQWREQYNDSNAKIARPRQIYNGVALDDYVAVEKRK